MDIEGVSEDQWSMSPKKRETLRDLADEYGLAKRDGAVAEADLIMEAIVVEVEKWVRLAVRNRPHA